MRFEFNDYKRLTRGYLKDYRTWKSAIDAWAQERVEIESELASVPVAISKYGDESGGGTGELNCVESEANKRIKLGERVIAIDSDTHELRRIMKNVDTAMHALDDESMRIIDMHYLQGRTWYDVADAFDCSEGTARQKGARAIAKMAFILFGQKANPYEQVVLIA